MAKGTVLANQPKPPLKMKFAGGLVKHLGLQMYSGAVPSIGELVKNSYDANASEVDILIPFGEAWEEQSVITVKDNGHGMTYDQCDDRYLVIGRDRRQALGDVVEGSKTRKPIGRKGIGKLAGFGIADVVDVRTVRDGQLTEFTMRYSVIERKELGEEYEPDVEKAGVATRGKPGTLVTLRNIKLKRSLDENEFRTSMARRFALFSANFVVRVNGVPIERFEHDFQFRFPVKGQGSSPDKSMNVEQIAGHGQVRWWAGTTEKPIRSDEQRGFVVMVRSSSAQITPFFFNLSGSAGDQLGLQYLTGEVFADFIDEGSIDGIATDRASINWEKEETKPLLDWGRKKVLYLLNQWGKQRREKQEDRIERHEKYAPLIEAFPAATRDVIQSAVKQIAKASTLTGC